MAKRRAITAEELMRKMDIDPESAVRREARKLRHAEHAARIEADEDSLFADLKQVGVVVSSVYDFINVQAAPAAAWPVLVRHLEIEHHPRIREGIIRSLGLRAAREIAFVPLCVVYCRERDESVRWAIANALAAMARLREVDHLPGIAEYSSLFASR